MKQRNLGALEKSIQELQGNIEKIGHDKELVELLKIASHADWTTPAEGLLVAAIVRALNAQTMLMFELKNTLLTASREVHTKAPNSLKNRSSATKSIHRISR